MASAGSRGDGSGAKQNKQRTFCACEMFQLLFRDKQTPPGGGRSATEWVRLAESTHSPTPPPSAVSAVCFTQTQNTCASPRSQQALFFFRTREAGHPRAARAKMSTVSGLLIGHFPRGAATAAERNFLTRTSRRDSGFLDFVNTPPKAMQFLVLSIKSTSLSPTHLHTARVRFSTLFFFVVVLLRRISRTRSWLQSVVFWLVLLTMTMMMMMTVTLPVVLAQNECSCEDALY